MPNIHPISKSLEVWVCCFLFFTHHATFPFVFCDFWLWVHLLQDIFSWECFEAWVEVAFFQGTNIFALTNPKQCLNDLRSVSPHRQVSLLIFSGQCMYFQLSPHWITVLLGLTLRGPELSLQITSHHEAIRVATNASADTLKYLGAYLPPQFLLLFKCWPLWNPCFCASFAIHLKLWGLFICFFYTLTSILIFFLGSLGFSV